MLKEEIKSKYQDLRRLKKDYLFYLDQLKENIPEDLFQRILEYITNRSIVVLCVKESNLKRKINELETPLLTALSVDRSVVENLSSRVLTNEEIDCLAQGLDYGLVPNLLGTVDPLRAHGDSVAFQNAEIPI